MEQHRLLRWLLELAIIIALVAMVRAYQQRDIPGGMAPPLQGTTVQGHAIDLRQHRGQVVLVHFWADWCPICRAEQDSIAAVAKDWPVLAVAMQSGDTAAVNRYLDENGLHFPVLNDPQGQHAQRWGVRGVPTSLVIGPSGRIRFVEVGYTSEAGLRTRLWLAQHLP